MQLYDVDQQQLRMAKFYERQKANICNATCSLSADGTAVLKSFTCVDGFAVSF
jgi:hypothetical protein